MASAVDSWKYRYLKRGFDVVASAFGLILLAPGFLLIICIIWFDSPGPAIYVQERSGESRKTFLMFKFRTMSEDADAQLAGLLYLNMHQDTRLYKIPDDPRVTRVGKFLRRYSLDELPQLVNVLKGEMSLVGPRPLMLIEDQHVEGQWCSRATVKPGITGLWQVSGCNKLPFEEMMRLDLLYVAEWSFWHDLWLIARTLLVVMSGD